MDDKKQQQIEALQVAADYSAKIVTALHNIIAEYSGDKKEDTDEYEQHIIKGLNWIFEVYNGTRDLLAENGCSIDKDVVNQSVMKLNLANQNNDDKLRVEALEGICDFVTKFQQEAVKY